MHWKCTRGHILGYVERSGQRHQLTLLRHAISDGESPGPILATIQGLAISIQCDICGCTRTWSPDPERSSVRQLYVGVVQ